MTSSTGEVVRAAAAAAKGCMRRCLRALTKLLSMAGCASCLQRGRGRFGQLAWMQERLRPYLREAYGRRGGGTARAILLHLGPLGWRPCGAAVPTATTSLIQPIAHLRHGEQAAERADSLVGASHCAPLLLALDLSTKAAKSSKPSKQGR